MQVHAPMPAWPLQRLRFQTGRPSSLQEELEEGEGKQESGAPPAQLPPSFAHYGVLKSLLNELSMEVDRLIAEQSNVNNVAVIPSDIPRMKETLQVPMPSGDEASSHNESPKSQSLGQGILTQEEYDALRSVSKHTMVSSSHSSPEARKLEAEDQYEALYDLTRAFHVLCSRDRCNISIDELIEMAGNHHMALPEDDYFQVMASRFQLAVNELNTSLGIYVAHGSKEPAKVIALDTFIALMHQKSNFFKNGDPAIVSALVDIKDILVKEDALRKVAKATKMSFCDINKSRSTHRGSIWERSLLKMDPIIGCVIMMNAVSICVSTDVDPNNLIWQYIEGGFTFVFLVEIIFKIKVYGCRVFLCGSDRGWNIFDIFVVLIAVMDILYSVVQSFDSLNNFTFIRLLRFLRLTKLVRVLKLKCFHELTLMINGILQGLRTLLWAVVFLAFMLSALGVLITQLASHPDFMTEQTCNHMAGGQLEWECRLGVEHMNLHSKELFGNVFRSCFTVFRCITDGCTSVDGTPLMPYFYNTYGYVVVFFYMVVVLFVIFGLFNLIMAIFVENTIANSGQVEAKRNEAVQKEHIQIARKLQDVIVMFCIGESTKTPSAYRRSTRGAMAAIKSFRALLSTETEESEDSHETHVQQISNSTNLSLTVSHGTFNKMLERKDIQDMLDDLDIQPTNRGSLFEVLDANNNGTLEVSELVQGLLKLRGPINKGESVAALLAVRSMQKSMKSMQVLSLHQQHVVEAIAERVEALSDGLQNSNTGQHSHDFLALTTRVPRKRLEQYEPEARRQSAVIRAIEEMKKEATASANLADATRDTTKI